MPKSWSNPSRPGRSMSICPSKGGGGGVHISGGGDDGMVSGSPTPRAPTPTCPQYPQHPPSCPQLPCRCPHVQQCNSSRGRESDGAATRTPTSPPPHPHPTHPIPTPHTLASAPPLPTCANSSRGRERAGVPVTSTARRACLTTSLTTWVRWVVRPCREEVCVGGGGLGGGRHQGAAGRCRHLPTCGCGWVGLGLGWGLGGRGAGRS